MEVRPGANPADVKNYDTDRLRHDFLIQDLSQRYGSGCPRPPAPL